MFSATSNKRKSPTNKKTDEINNKFLENATLILPSLQRTGRANEDPNLPIDDRRKSYYPTSNGTPINNRRICVAGGSNMRISNEILKS